MVGPRPAGELTRRGEVVRRADRAQLGDVVQESGGRT
jgi:hypothetical protein